MSDIFSGDGGGGDGWIGWNAKTFKWTVNGDPADPKSMLVDARSFGEGWIRFNPYDAVFPHPEDGPIAQPAENLAPGFPRENDQRLPVIVAHEQHIASTTLFQRLVQAAIAFAPSFTFTNQAGDLNVAGIFAAEGA